MVCVDDVDVTAVDTVDFPTHSTDSSHCTGHTAATWIAHSNIHIWVMDYAKRNSVQRKRTEKWITHFIGEVSTSGFTHWVMRFAKVTLRSTDFSLATTKTMSLATTMPMTVTMVLTMFMTMAMTMCLTRTPVSLQFKTAQNSGSGSTRQAVVVVVNVLPGVGASVGTLVGDSDVLSEVCVVSADDVTPCNNAMS